MSFFILAFASITLCLPLFIAHGFFDKLIASLTLILPIAGAVGWYHERTLVRDFRVAEATVFKVNRWSRTRELEYRFRASEDGPLVLGHKAKAGGCKVGMTLPVIYSPSDPNRNSAPGDLVFYQM